MSVVSTKYADAPSLWSSTAEPGPALQMLETDLSADVVIVGAATLGCLPRILCSSEALSVWCSKPDQ